MTYKIITGWRRSTVERKINESGGDIVHVTRGANGKLWVLVEKSP